MLKNRVLGRFFGKKMYLCSMIEKRETSTGDFALTLLRWFSENGRELPWRATADPYAIWISEIILQQTQVKQGQSYWERFMKRWPTVGLLAAATEDEVLREWQGLGYYSRARNLHYAARQIVAMGGFPQTYEGLRSLKGVGEYTAAAIGSFAFGLPLAVVDGNVYRVLSRYFGIDTPINTTEGKKEFAALAQALLPTAQSSSLHSAHRDACSSKNSQLYNQAIMDFGALQCTPQSPQCPSCPLIETCVACREGRVSSLPVKLKTLKVRERHFTYLYLRCEGQVAIHRRGEGDIWQGLWEPYLIESDEAAQPDLRPLFGSEAPAPTYRLTLLRQQVRHVLTHRVLLADFYLLETDARPTVPADFVWVNEHELERYAVPRLVEMLFNEVNRQSVSKY